MHLPESLNYDLLRSAERWRDVGHGDESQVQRLISRDPQTPVQVQQLFQQVHKSQSVLHLSEILSRVDLQLCEKPNSPRKKITLFHPEGLF